MAPDFPKPMFLSQIQPGLLGRWLFIFHKTDIWALGTLKGPSGSTFGPLGPLRALLAGPLGPFKGPPSSTFGPLGPLRAHLVLHLGPWGPFGDPFLFGAHLGPICWARWGPWDPFGGARPGMQARFALQAWTKLFIQKQRNWEGP